MSLFRMPRSASSSDANPFYRHYPAERPRSGTFPFIENLAMSNRIKSRLSNFTKPLKYSGSSPPRSARSDLLLPHPQNLVTASTTIPIVFRTPATP